MNAQPLVHMDIACALLQIVDQPPPVIQLINASLEIILADLVVLAHIMFAQLQMAAKPLLPLHQLLVHAM
jgi:hypothetical protein